MKIYKRLRDLYFIKSSREAEGDLKMLDFVTLLAVLQ